jgi:hypothetical protein
MPFNKFERMDKFDPYEECPCGSRKKFKFCCFQSAKDDQKTSVEKFKGYSDKRIQHEANKMWEDTDFKICLGFTKDDCRPLIKNAHALQNNRILNRISEQGHVFNISSNISKKGIDADFKKISKNKASTFFGFCDFHDNELFKPIEQKEYKNEEIQNFLFGFRGFCLEYHRKIRKLNTLRNNFKASPGFMLSPIAVQLYRNSEFDIADSQTEYETFRKDYFNKDFNKLRTIHRRLNKEVEFAVSSSFAVKDDLHGNVINDIYSVNSEIVPNIHLNIFPVDGETVIILSYHNNYDSIYSKYFDELRELSDEDLEIHLNFLVINYTENIFFSPRLLKKLSDEQKRSLLASFQSSMDAQKTYELIKDGQFFNFNLFSWTSC